MPSAIEKAIQDVVFNDLEESYIPCADKPTQESIRVMSYAVKNKLPKEYKDTLAITKISEDGMLFVKIYKRACIETWVRDKITGKLVPSKEKLLSPEEVKVEEYKSRLSKGNKIEKLTECFSQANFEPENESWKTEEKDVRKSEKELMKEMLSKESTPEGRERFSILDVKVVG